ncbi:MAG: NAD(+)/NADH kinase [Abitibacteriaceae bacterium]|nr:NAD(+)/NADH kinase [Abditibacteriaceae bacterium]
MRSLGVFAAPKKPNVQGLLRQLVALAEAHQIAIHIQKGIAREIGREDLGSDSDDAIAACDVLVTLSGDGGVLTAARATARYGTPVLAVDLGRLGFLSSVRPTELEQAFTMLVEGKFEVEERMMLDARVFRSHGTQHSALSTQHSPPDNSHSTIRNEVGGSIGLNDAVVAKSALARILRLSIFVSGDLVAETRADGLIISTPTGSTAYALSAGGPIIHPDVPSLLICPICAHSLTQRPVIVDSGETIEVHAEWEGDEVSSSELEAMLTIDGQIGVFLQSGDVVQVKRADCKARLLHLPRETFYERLREKMRWGR